MNTLTRLFFSVFTVGIAVMATAPIRSRVLAQNRMNYSIVDQKSGHAALGLAIRKLSVSGTFMQSPAHPDDETNGLFALFTCSDSDLRPECRVRRSFRPHSVPRDFHIQPGEAEVTVLSDGSENSQLAGLAMMGSWMNGLARTADSHRPCATGATMIGGVWYPRYRERHDPAKLGMMREALTKLDRQANERGISSTRMAS